MKTSKTNPKTTSGNAETSKTPSKLFEFVEEEEGDDLSKFECDTLNKVGIIELRKRHPWPKEKPDVPNDWSGFFTRLHKNVFTEFITEETKVVLELGSWLGKSTRFIQTQLPADGAIICVDHWKGSPEHHENPKWAGKLPTLYETFLKNQWEIRDQVTPIKDSTIDGIKAVRAHMIKPDLIFIDAGHDYENVSTDIRLCIETFPEAILVMDDYDDKWHEVKRACDEAAKAHGKDYEKLTRKRVCILRPRK